MSGLAQCWYTRVHHPDRKYRGDDGSYASHCRHCGKAITSWGTGGWYLADGFNVSRLRDSTGAGFLYIIDVSEDLVIARYPTDHLETPKKLRAYREELRKMHGLDEPGCTLQLRDGRHSARAH